MGVEIAKLVLGVVLVVAAQSIGSYIAYRNGFRDGALWLHRGDTYPSKPGPGWWWWGRAEREGLEPGVGLQVSMDRHKAKYHTVEGE